MTSDRLDELRIQFLRFLATPRDYDRMHAAEHHIRFDFRVADCYGPRGEGRQGLGKGSLTSARKDEARFSFDGAVDGYFWESGFLQDAAPDRESPPVRTTTCAFLVASPRKCFTVRESLMALAAAAQRCSNSRLSGQWMRRWILNDRSPYPYRSKFAIMTLFDQPASLKKVLLASTGAKVWSASSSIRGRPCRRAIWLMASSRIWPRLEVWLIFMVGLFGMEGGEEAVQVVGSKRRQLAAATEARLPGGLMFGEDFVFDGL